MREVGGIEDVRVTAAGPTAGAREGSSHADNQQFRVARQFGSA